MIKGQAILLLVTVIHGGTGLEVASIDVNKQSTKKLLPFWASTGFCPPDPHSSAGGWLNSLDVQTNLDYIASLPHSSIKHVRVHWVLNLITVTRILDGLPQYNFTELDEFMDGLFTRNLRLGFELMGNPSGVFNDFSNNTQLVWWKKLVYDTAKRYIDLYGLDYVESWLIETWNEPQHKDFDNLTMTADAFQKYCVTSASALKALGLSLGGPADRCDKLSKQEYCRAFLQAANDSHLQPRFISIHQKGGGHKRSESVNSSSILVNTLNTILDIVTLYPSLQYLPIVNDEADPLVGWSRPEEWRADARYAAIVIKVIAEHVSYFEESNSMEMLLLSNDNGFLSYYPNQFTQRTLLARFQINNTNPTHVQFIKKPVYLVTGLLTLHGETFLHVNDLPVGVEGFGSIHRPSNPLAYSDSWQLTMTFSYSLDVIDTGPDIPFTLNITKIPPNVTDDMVLALYTVDQIHTNPYKVWRSLGSPAYPSREQFHIIRSNTEPVVQLWKPFDSGSQDYVIQRVGPYVVVNLRMTVASVVTLHVCAKSKEEPDQVTNVALRRIADRQTLITWDDSCVHSKCIKTYEVEYKDDVQDWIRVNQQDTVFNNFLFDLSTVESTGSGVEYRVRAVDYWDRPGEYSLPMSST